MVPVKRAMDSDEEVDYEIDCICISRSKKRRTSTAVVADCNGRSRTPRSNGAILDDCIIVGNSDSVRGDDEVDCVEVNKDKNNKDETPKEKTNNGHAARMNQSPKEPSVDTLTNREPEPTASGSTPISAQSEDPLLDSIFSSISDMDKFMSTELHTKDQTVPSIPPFNVPLPSGILTEVSRTPKCWTVCPNCPVGMERKYHLIDVVANSAEWDVVASQLRNTGFIVNRIRRIQNESLWQRLCYEKQLMLREKKTVNEQLLYHTSRGEVEVIAEEGLDSRLSHNGSFGAGIYFR